MPMAIFTWQRTWHIYVWRIVGETCSYECFCGSLWLLSTILRQIQVLISVLRERAESFLSIVHRTNAEQKYHQWKQLTHFHCTIAQRRPPSPFRQSRVLRSLADVR